MKLLCKILLSVLKFLWNIIKHMFLLSFYCSMPDKYSGVTYDEWLNDKETEK